MLLELIFFGSIEIRQNGVQMQHRAIGGVPCKPRRYAEWRETSQLPGEGNVVGKDDRHTELLAGTTEVRQLDGATRRDQDVGPLDVSVHDLCKGMGVRLIRGGRGGVWRAFSG